MKIPLLKSPKNFRHFQSAISYRFLNLSSNFLILYETMVHSLCNKPKNTPKTIIFYDLFKLQNPSSCARAPFCSPDIKREMKLKNSQECVEKFHKGESKVQ